MTTEARGPTAIRTRSGRLFDVFDPNPDDINILDIAHALSNQCRFSGHTRFHYSVAQHSVAVSNMVPTRFALAGLLHDASEAYLVDLPSPLKHHPEFGRIYREVEGRVSRAIYAKFGVDWSEECAEAVHEADSEALETEQRYLMGGEIVSLGPPKLRPTAAKIRFLSRFMEITGLTWWGR